MTEGITTYDLVASLNSSGVAVSSNIVNVTNLAASYSITGSPGLQGAPGSPGEAGTPGVGVPTGGLTGEALIKNSNNNYDTVWEQVDFSIASGLTLIDANNLKWVVSIDTTGALITTSQSTSITNTFGTDFGTLVLA